MPEHDIAPIRIFHAVHDKIKKIDTHPLCIDSLEINQDAYAELSGSEPEGRPFARFDYSFPRSDKDLSFTMDFADNGIALGGAMHDMVFCPYEHLGDTSRQVAERVMEILTALANGQIALLLTTSEDGEETQAVEVLYRRKNAKCYTPLLTAPFFDQKRKYTPDQLTTTLLANSADIPEVNVHLPTYRLLLAESDSKQYNYNRKALHDLNIPLDSATWEASIDAHYKEWGEGVEERIDEWFGTDKTLGTKEQLIQDYKRSQIYRHISLLWVTTFGASILYNYFLDWGRGPAYIILALAILVLLVWFRKKLIPMFIWPIGIVSYFTAGLVFYHAIASQPDRDAFWWIVIIVLGVEILETLAGDGIQIWRFVKRLREQSSTF